MSDRYYGDLRQTVFSRPHRHDNCARPEFSTFHMTGSRFVTPEIRVGNDEANLRFGICHRRYRTNGLIVVQEFVEMIVCRVHPGCFDGIGNLGR